MAPTIDAVTGAFGFTGKYIARRLLALGRTVITLTGHPQRFNSLGVTVKAFPYRFDRPEIMAETLANVEVLYNTYWVRFDRGATTHERAVANTITLLRAAKMARIKRLVHISIINPDMNSSLSYFRGKARLEEEIRKSEISYAIVRPTVIFGQEDILINNIAFLLRTMPVFMIPGSGQYYLQPVYVEDVARIAVEAAERLGDLVIDAVGPEVFSFDELVRMISRIVRSHAILLHVPPGLALYAAQAIGAALGDVVLTRDEMKGLMANLLRSESPPTGSTSLSSWLSTNRATLGKRYSSELHRHFEAD